MNQKSLQTRIAFIDAGKVVAMQIIVWHHLVSYGPLATAARVLCPDLVIWLYDHGRVAVQLFLVIGGYLAARVLSPHGEAFKGRLLPTVINRYLRLTPPYIVALLLATACAVFARHWINDEEFIPAAPDIWQSLAHVFLVHDLFDFDSLSAGVWYVAIDFQLFVLLASLLWLSARLARQSAAAHALGVGGVLLLSLASLLWFSRQPDYDIWAIYFFAAYGLGALAYWAEKGRRHVLLAFRLLLAAAVIALLFDFRSRLLVALCTALALHLMAHHGLKGRLPHAVHALAHMSYALFLVHFPIYMLVSAVFARHGLDMQPWSALAGLMLTWLLSIAAAYLLHRYVEKPASRMRLATRPSPASRCNQS